MSEVRNHIQTLFAARGFQIPSNRSALFEDFASTSECVQAVSTILENQNRIMEKWKTLNRLVDIKAQQISIPNATIHKPYETTLDLKFLNLEDIIIESLQGVEDIGLIYNRENNTIQGVPTKSGDIQLKLIFNLKGESNDAPLNEKSIILIINPDPKTLWKDLPSDSSDPFWKEDDQSICTTLGDRNIVVSSKRGRSHKNIGSFRDDDFSFKYYEETGWSVVAVSDGAGSYSLSRKGSQLACRSVIEFFELQKSHDSFLEMETGISNYNLSRSEDDQKKAEGLAKQYLYKAVVYVHQKIKEHAEKTFTENPELFENSKSKNPLDQYHATLIFAAFKKFEFGYLVLTFGVGDCPIAIMDNETSHTTLLNWLDVGEFGGGTRFITQTDIYHSTERPIVSRFNFKIIPNFSFLFLMTDGIYDPKFVVEANLEKDEKWQEFLLDLQGANEENAKVEFSASNKDLHNQLSNWMDFWSPGNHDDRTLAIVY